MGMHDNLAVYEDGYARSASTTTKIVERDGEDNALKAAVPTGTPFAVVSRADWEQAFASAGVAREAIRINVETGELTIDQDAYDATIEATSKKALKLSGVEFEGVFCSAEAEDMWGLNAVEGFVRAGNPTPFKFTNGNVLVLTPQNMDAFQTVWVPFRASFFG